jgi:alpha-L-fucosidase
MTMNKTWGYKSYDHNWKSAELLIRNLVDIASKGGNYLLNIGPKADGTIPEESVERLQVIGRWMSVNGESIHATTASPTERPSWGRITTRPGDESTTLYLHIFDWPSDGKLPVAVSNDVEDCRHLANPGQSVKVDCSETAGLIVHLTGERPDPICSVVRLELKGKPQVVDRSNDEPNADNQKAVK